ncbi:MAG: 30S ribosome-binding factor RbfA [Planctomycetes bacterium]|nr:30S ribosome-binding factor RbfA [Planctomycetota bacterium]
MNERRIARLQEQIKHRLAEVLLRDLADPKLGMVTITRVELDSEFTHCRAYWSVIGDEAQRARSSSVLRRARGLCQRAMADAISTRTVPHLDFVYDEGIEKAIRMKQLLEEVRLEREARERAQGIDPTGPIDPDEPSEPDPESRPD